jgi:hypothetical protein
MKKEITLREHLSKARVKAHETQRKNGQYVRMAKIKAEKQKAKVQ